MVGRTWRILMAMALGIALLITPAAHGQAFCDDGQEPSAGAAYSALAPVLADVMGEPLECQQEGANGDLLQQTTSGLAFLEASTGTPQFTNGFEHWALTDSDLAYWIAPPAESPPPTAVEPGPGDVAGMPSPPPPTGPVPGLVLLPWQDTSNDPARPFMYLSRRRCSYAAEAFERGTPGAVVAITYIPNIDDSPQKPNQPRLVLEWPGFAEAKTAAGPVASARVGVMTARWTSYTDRMVQDVVVPARPAGDRLNLQLNGQAIMMARDSSGGYLVTDTSRFARFMVRQPTVVDAAGLSRLATLTWNFPSPSASIAIDPVFLTTAAYPLTVSTTFEFGTVVC